MNSNSKNGPSPAGPLTAEQIASFQAEGFVIVPGLFGAGEIEQIDAWADEVHDWPETPGRHMMYFEASRAHPGQRILNRIENVLPYHGGFRALAVGPKMQGACSQLFGQPAVLFKDKINYKMPGGGGFEAHQDVQAGWARYANLHITVLITVDKTTLANGCLEMAKGFHDRGLIGTEWTPLTEDDLRDAEFIAVESEPGDAVFFDSFAPHRSAPNNSATRRRVLYYTYNQAAEGDSRERYYADKRASYPPDIEREDGKEYHYRV